MQNILPLCRFRWAALFALVAQIPATCWAVSSEKPAHWVSCVPAIAMPPYLSNDVDHPGLIERLMVAAGKEVGVAIEVQYLPLPRCMAMLERGQVDAAIGAPTESVRKFARFPVHDAKPHAAQSIARVKVVLVARADAPGTWSAPRSYGSNDRQPVVAVRRRTSTVIEPLVALGFKVNESTLALSSALGMLRLGRVDYVAVVEEELAEYERSTKLEGFRIERPPVLEQDYYAGVSLARWSTDEELVKRWWAVMARLRHTSAFAR